MACRNRIPTTTAAAAATAPPPAAAAAVLPGLSTREDGIFLTTSLRRRSSQSTTTTSSSLTSSRHVREYSSSPSRESTTTTTATTGPKSSYARVVVIGTGRMGQIRTRLINSNPKFELIGIVDPKNYHDAITLASTYRVSGFYMSGTRDMRHTHAEREKLDLKQK